MAPPASQPIAAPLPWLLMLLSVTTGLVDATSVLGLDKVFTANMTGNIVFLGFAVVGTPGFQVMPAVTALVSFLAGALVAGRIGRTLAGRPMRHWLLAAALFETSLFWIAAVVAAGLDAAQLPGDPHAVHHRTWIAPGLASCPAWKRCSEAEFHAQRALRVTEPQAALLPRHARRYAQAFTQIAFHACLQFHHVLAPLNQGLGVIHAHAIRFGRVQPIHFQEGVGGALAQRRRATVLLKRL